MKIPFRLALLFLALAVAAVLALRFQPPSVDSVVTGFMEHEKIPGAALAVAAGGEIVMSRGYGFADSAGEAPVTPSHRFRIASLSKPITAAAAMALVRDGRLQLEDRMADLLPEIDFVGDERYREVTVRHLLSHRAGWDRAETFEPMLEPDGWATLGLDSPADCRPVAVAMAARPLQFAPGDRYAYSNVGYCFLGLIIEKLSGTSYEAFARSRFLDPLALTSFRLGGFADEDGLIARSFESSDEPGNLLGVLGPAGGWTATASDLAQLLSSPAARPPLRRPTPHGRAPHFYDLGWRVWPKNGGTDYTHFGAMPGAFSLAVHTGGGLTIIVLMNGRPTDDWKAFVRLYKELGAAVGRDFPD